MAIHLQASEEDYTPLLAIHISKNKGGAIMQDADYEDHPIVLCTWE